MTESHPLPPSLSAVSRRSFLAQVLALAATLPQRGNAQEASEPTPAAPGGTPFSFDILSQRMQAAAQEEYVPPTEITGPAAALTYDDYRKVQFRPERARWAGEDARAVLHAYHPGWLFRTPVHLHEVVDGQATPMQFTREDFRYYDDLDKRFSEDADLPGVAGFRINAPLNNPTRFDEVVSFLGASYFRALGRDNLYGLSARGLALNTAIGGEEEFPAFTEFWLERPAPGQETVTFYAALHSPSVAGAFRFTLTPGETTEIAVDQRLYFRDAVDQVGIAPLTSMFLFAPNDMGDFHDYRARVHDSEGLVVVTGDRRFFRPLRNPARLGNSYIGAVSPTAFGLEQRARSFDAYLDSHAGYERRPSLIVEPVGDWGRGAVRLIEIPTKLESNDNIAAFWVPEAKVQAGDALELSYRLLWGMGPLKPDSEHARVLRTLAGHGGVAGIEPARDRQKFVIDFGGSILAELSAAEDVKAKVSARNGEVVQSIVERLEEEGGIWRLVLEVRAEDDAPVELSADLTLDDLRLTETWLYQWTRT
ncbi:glucan biosynthesis protein [Sagittula salina]|uniref:Glucan biosynthesis protein G n=1 Tax=Sagittula salina TaxID=2820268 RepID=A0A940MLA9_9RHOB|nr:glucan biosynthesis protein G [Sagittula salina]MBP0483910.1 glucan biosynthesis protein G [Sagittula salina]